MKNLKRAIRFVRDANYYSAHRAIDDWPFRNLVICIIARCVKEKGK